MADIQKLYEQWLAKATADPDLKAELESIKDDEDGKNDRFYRDLEFGTGGLRGVIGAGTNRMNVYTVKKATQGLAEYILASGEKKSVAISCDSRIKSDYFSKSAAEVLAANGIKVHIYKELMPTPMLSWAVRALNCGAGVMVTASHNPAKYNGYKVYGNDGCQLTLEAAEAVLAKINAIDIFDGVKSTDFDKAVADGMISFIGDDVIDAYMAKVKEQGLHTDLVASSGLKVVYTPLNGTGNKPVRRILREIGVKDVVVVPEQENPDGNFPTCPYPNPEIKEALACGLKLCETEKPDLLLATDPDCDRVGIAVPDGDHYELFTGNEVGALLLEYICKERIALGTMPKNPVAVKTIVTTDITKAICKKYGVELREVLTGFKFIGEQIGLLEKEGHTERYIFGFEESYGYLSGTSVRDKDAVNAAVLVCEMAANYKAQGLTLLDKLEQLREEFGFYAQRLLTFQYEGESGAAKMADIMRKLRAPLDTFADAHFPTATRIDYQNDETGLPKSDVLSFALADGSKIIVRPSGTEPKLKAYLFARGENQAAAEKVLDELETLMNGYCKE